MTTLDALRNKQVEQWDTFDLQYCVLDDYQEFYIAGQMVQRLGCELRVPGCMRKHFNREWKENRVSYHDRNGEVVDLPSWYSTRYRSRAIARAAFRHLLTLYPASKPHGNA